LQLFDDQPADFIECLFAPLRVGLVESVFDQALNARVAALRVSQPAGCLCAGQACTLASDGIAQDRVAVAPGGDERMVARGAGEQGFGRSRVGGAELVAAGRQKRLRRKRRRRVKPQQGQAGK